MDLKPGDLFLTASPGLVSSLIIAMQRFWSQDDHARYTHAGIILNHAGDVFEMVGKGAVTNGSLYAYKGKPCLIARHEAMTPVAFECAIQKSFKRLGDIYPVHRLLLHIFPPAAKYWGVGMAVCSEMVAEFCYFAGITDYWMGVNPDELEEMFRHWKGFEIVYEGILRM